MFTRTRAAALPVALAVLALAPAVANAGSQPMRGVVSGSPYGASSGQMAVPVLFSKTTARNAGLKSPVGVVIMKRTQRVKLPGGGTALPVQLRTGDRFKGVGDVGSLQRRVFYPRVVFSKPVVYFRSKELSLSELSTAIDALKKAIADLQAFRDASIKAFQDIYTQLADIRKQLAALQALSVPNFQAQIDALTKRLNDLIASLPDFSKFALVSQLPDLTQYVKLSDLSGLVTNNTTVQSLVTQVSTLTTQLNTVCNALKNATVAIPAPINATVPVTVNTGGVC